MRQSRRPSSLVWLQILPLFALLSQGAAAPVSEAADGHTLWVAVQDRSGRPVEGLVASDFEVLEDSVPAEVLAAAPGAGEPWQVVVYLDSALSQTSAVQRLAGGLLDVLPSLLALGEVELVLADPVPRTLLPSTSEPALLQPALEGLNLRATSEDALRHRRRTFLERQREFEEAQRRGDPGDRPAPLELARGALREEVLMLREQQDSLLEWLAERGAGRGPRLLVLLNDALGHDPLDFYLPRLQGAAELALETQDLPDTRELAEALSALGWVCLPVGLVRSEREPGLRYDPSAEVPVGFRLRLGDKDDQPASAEEGTREGSAEGSAEVDLGLDDPATAQLEELARSTGGTVIGGVEQLVPRFAGVASRYRLDWRPREPGSGLARPRPLEVRARRDGLEVLAPRFTTRGAVPEAISGVRLRRALAGEIEGESLELEARIELDLASGSQSPARLRVEADLSEIQRGPLRLSVGVSTGSGDLVMRHEELPLTSPPTGELWSHEQELVLPAGTNAALVLLESLSSGDFGIAFADLADRRLDAGAPDSDRARQLAGERAVRLVPADPAVRSGRSLFVAETRSDVARVEFWLNGQRVATRDRPPFEARLELEARYSEVVAVAFGGDGFELDRDQLLVNEPAESFWVRIVEPRSGRRIGAVDVEVDLKLPAGSALDRIDFYWGDRRSGSVVEPPFRSRVLIPVDHPDGYIRVEAVLRDGRVAEDVVLMNRPGFGAQIGVELVELYLVATDRNGQPVRGLGREDFTVLEDQVEQEVETFAVAGDLPLTIGLALDTSSSLFLRMPSVQRAARDFTRSLVSERDRAFLVEFGSSPRLVRNTTADLRSILDGIAALEPFGTTPVWEAITLSLGELEKVPGRRALVVFYDGDDEDEHFDYGDCLRRARQSQLPIYLIVMNDEAARTEGRSFSTRAFVSRLDRLASAGGGRVYYVSTQQDLGEIFQAISEELRSHYLLTYYPQHAAGGPQWRPVEVRVKGRGLQARTIEGYSEEIP